MDVKSSSSDEKSKKNKSESDASNIKSENISKSNDEEEQLINYFTYINNCLSKNEENRQNYVNKLSELKSQIENIKNKSITSIEYSLLILSEFTTLCDTFYSSFAEKKIILEKFNELNDSAQNINFCYEKANYSNLYFKESNKKLGKQYEKLYKENQNLKQLIQEIKSAYNKEKNQNELSEINNEKKEMKNKIDKIMEENIELKRRYSQILNESKIIKNYADEKFISVQEDKRRMSTLLNKIDIYEEKIDKMQKKINQYETERTNTENNKESEIKNNTFNNRYENENIINLETNKSELSDNISIKQGINLDELLIENKNDEEEEKLSKNKSININNDKKKFSEKNSEYSGSIKRYNDYDIDAEINTSPNFLMLCPIKKLDKKIYKHERNNIHIYKSPFSFIGQSKSQTSLVKEKKNKNAKSVINGGNNFSKNYYKIFFFLLLKSIIINRNIKEFFKKNDFDSLFEECQNGRIPFNQYEEWIINKFKLNGDECDEKLSINNMINDCFICSSII